MPSDGSLLPGTWLHSHRGRLYGILLLASPLASLRMSCSDFNITRMRLPDQASEDFETLQDFNVHARVDNVTAAFHAIRSRGRVVCSSLADDADAPTFVSLNGTSYDRQGVVRCEPWEFRRGEEWTVVVFHIAQFHREAELFNMHSVFFMHADLHSGNASLDAELECSGWNICSPD